MRAFIQFLVEYFHPALLLLGVGIVLYGIMVLRGGNYLRKKGVKHTVAYNRRNFSYGDTSKFSGGAVRTEGKVYMWSGIAMILIGLFAIAAPYIAVLVKR